MKRTTPCALILLAAIVLPVGALAEDQHDEPDVIAPFVNDYTLAVGRLDLADIDFAALEQWATTTASQPSIPQEQREQIAPLLRQGITAARQWTGNFTKAGGREIWVVFSIESWPRNSPVFLVVPLARGANAAALTPLFAGGGAVLQIHDALIVPTDHQGPEWIKQIKSKPRQFTHSIKSAPAGQLQIAVVPSEDARKVIESMAPQISGGRPALVESIAGNLLGAVIAARISPGPSLDVHTESGSEPGAQNLKQALESLVHETGEPEEHARRALRTAASELLRQAKVDGNRVTINLDREQTTRFAAHLSTALFAARENATRLQSASNIRQLLQGCFIYANNSKNVLFPDTLEQAVTSADLPPGVLTSPRTPAEKIGYQYIKPAEGARAPTERLVIYEKYDHFDGGINVGFADGHVEFISSQAQFQKLLEEARHPHPQKEK